MNQFFKKVKKMMQKEEINTTEQVSEDTSIDQELNENATATETEHSAENEEDTDKSTSETELLEAQVVELKDKYIRLFAEFDNFKKRSVKEKLDLMKTASQDTLTALLPILDDFDRAKNSGEAFSEGVNLVYQKLYNSLKNMGLVEMVSTGEVFNPELHESITEIPVEDESMKGKVFDTVEKGYFLHEKIIRFAKVVIAK